METRQPPPADQFTQSGLVLGDVFCANTAVGAIIAAEIARTVRVDLISFFMFSLAFILFHGLITTQINRESISAIWCSTYAHCVV